jgi:cbb3-type cytochrome oxidase subunit 3
MAYLSFLGDLGINLIAIFLLAYVVYYRKHRRRDLLLAYIALNVGLFVAMSLLTTVRIDIALGFGLFAILSIIRLRSNTITQEEVAYYFVTLVLGLVNGVRLDDRWMTVLLSAVLIAVMYVADHRGLLSRAQRRVVTLDVVHHDEADLVQDLQRRLRGRVVHHQVDEIDYVRDVMVVDVRYQADPPGNRREQRTTTLAAPPPWVATPRPGVPR